MMALSPGSSCIFASLQPSYSYMLNAMSAQDDMEEVVLYTLEKTVQEVGILRFNPPPAFPIVVLLVALHTELLILVQLLVAVLSMLLHLDRLFVTFHSLHDYVDVEFLIR